MNAKITTFIAESTDGEYFTAHLDNGCVRIGLRGSYCFMFEANHVEHVRVIGLAAHEIEAAHDEFMGKYVAC